MNIRNKSGTILMAEDDPDDCLLTQEAFEESQLTNDLRFVQDGEELLDYLHRRGKFTQPTLAPWPSLILLDLNMPRKDGREVLKELKDDPHLCQIPVIILTTSQSDEDIIYSYNLGANSFITKPVTFDGLVNVMKILGQYWFDTVILPPSPSGI